MKERHEMCGSDPVLKEMLELEKNYRETSVEELESFELRLQRLKDTGSNVEDFVLDGMIDLTKQAIRIKQEEGNGKS